jgi:hypothetical protein
MTMTNPLKFLGVLLFVLFLAAVAVADDVTFDLEPLGAVYGNPVGMSPGDFMFHEYGADLYVDDFFSSGTPFFNYAQIDPSFAAPFVFGNDQTMEVNNVGVVFDFSSAGDVTFEYLNQGGSVNLRVNGFGVVLEGPDLASLAGVVAPGVNMNVTVVPVTGGGHKGVVTLTGPVVKLRVGGQELWLDTVRCNNGYVAGVGGSCDFEVSHQTQPLGQTWGTGTHAPGDLMFVEDGIPVFIGEIDWGAGTGFNFCDIQAPGIVDFGFDRVMNINNVSNIYKISSLGITVESVSFEYVDFGGMENLQVNGAALHIGDLPTFPVNIAPGVTLNVTTFAMAGGGERGVVVLTGDVQLLVLAGQEFMVDNICVKDVAGSSACDLVSDNESQAPGSFWGAPYGESPGDIIFTEDGIDVGLTLFDDGSGPLFNYASTDVPWGFAGTGNVMHINNIGVTYDLALFSPITEVSFDYAKGDGVENLGVDGLLYIGDIGGIPAAFFPGFNVAVTVNVGPGFTYGTVTVTGDVQQLIVGGQQFYIDDLCVVFDDASDVPQAATGGFELRPNYPNPFNPSTTFHYSLAKEGHVRLSIMDLAGHRLATLVDDVRVAGDHRQVWSGKDDRGHQAASGMYFVLLESDGRVAVRKIVMLK